jgi:sterol desaturase/sphingolipid hydroxylase (fatty acid hydroxylase superfamily)
MMRASEQSPRMFESDFVDFFSRTHPMVVPILFVPAVVALLWHSVVHAELGILPSLLLAVAGFITWTLAEYWLHRLFFHWQPGGKWGDRLHFLVHGVHHKWPHDKYRLVMPPAVSITLFFLFLGLFYEIFGARLVWAFHAGFVAGYMTYDLTHYYIHHFRPKTEYGRLLKKHHMLHHFKTPAARFGVSSMLWDRVFDTHGSAS